MKATASQYAKTLYELTKDKNHQEIDGVVSSLAKELEKNGQSRLAGSIIDKFSEIYNGENGIIEAGVITKEKINDGLKNKIKQFLKEKYSAKEVVLKNKVDETVKGGIVIKVGDEIIDGSLDRKLRELRSTLEK